LALPVGEVGQVVLALLPTRLQGFVGSLTTLSLPVMLTLYLGGDLWNFGIFGIFFLGGEKWMTVFCMAETEVLFRMFTLFTFSDLPSVGSYQN
jgi:hypothetical protein